LPVLSFSYFGVKIKIQGNASSSSRLEAIPSFLFGDRRPGRGEEGAIKQKETKEAKSFWMGNPRQFPA
jgi:hypothetical protein